MCFCLNHQEKVCSKSCQDFQLADVKNGYPCGTRSQLSNSILRMYFPVPSLYVAPLHQTSRTYDRNESLTPSLPQIRVAGHVHVEDGTAAGSTSPGAYASQSKMHGEQRRQQPLDESKHACKRSEAKGAAKLVGEVGEGFALKIS